MAALNMGQTGRQAVMVASSSNYTTVRHVLGPWRHLNVRPTEYKMRGFNASTGQYEYWSTTNPSAGPPSGATLTNKSIAAVLVDAFPTVE